VGRVEGEGGDGCTIERACKMERGVGEAKE
jgi:hypothetical protein